MKKSLITLLTIILSFCALFSQATFEKHQIGSPTQPRDVRVCDLNGDSHYDLVTVCNANGEVAWWENNGSMTFTKRVIATGFIGIRTIRTGDLNGDGSIDLVAGVVNEGRIIWWQNDGNQNFTQKILDGSFAGAHTIQITDLDADGDSDVLCSGWDNSPALSQIAWWENNGIGGFTKHTISGRYQQSPFILASDIDLDGDFDIISCCEAFGEVSWFENNGNLNFSERMIDPALPSAHTLAIKDVNKDGWPDILGSACLSNKQSWYQNNHDGTFTKKELPDLSWTMWLEAADFDFDGDMDLVGTGMNESALAFYTNNGQEKFTQRWLPGPITSGFAMEVIDFDHDSDDDIVLVGYNSHFLGWWENTTDRTALLKSPQWITPGEKPGEIYVANEYNGSIVKCQNEMPEKGIRSLGATGDIVYQNGTIWTTYGNLLLGLDAITGNTLHSVRVDAGLLMALAEGPEGELYISDPVGGSVWCFDPATLQASLLASGLTYPQAISHDPVNNQLIIMDGEETLELKSVNYGSGEIRLLISTDIGAGGDICVDSQGNLWMSSPHDNRIFRSKSPEFDQAFEFEGDFQGPAGLWYDENSGDLLVANRNSDQVNRYPVDLSGLEQNLESIGFEVYPNPAGDIVYIEMAYPGEKMNLQIRNSEGSVVKSITNDQPRFYVSLAGLPKGVYHMLVTKGGKCLPEISKAIIKL